ESPRRVSVASASSWCRTAKAAVQPPDRRTVPGSLRFMGAPGLVPPPSPHDRLGELRAVAEAVPGGLVDCSVGTPVDPMPEVAQRALAEAAAAATGYPPAIGAPAYREAAAAWIGRLFHVAGSAH